jgi:hypothetical protein
MLFYETRNSVRVPVCCIICVAQIIAGHDLLFDSGLQFRPTSGRRKRELSDKYWDAVTQELENGCTCVSFDLQGKPNDCVCVCRRVSPPPANPVLAFSTARRVLTLRMPSRIRPLLSEFLDLLLLVIQPLSGISGYVSPNTLQAQMQQHAAQATRLRSVFDPDLIEQEIRHGVFDPSGLFQAIGQVLKGVSIGTPQHIFKFLCARLISSLCTNARSSSGGHGAGGTIVCT